MSLHGSASRELRCTLVSFADRGSSTNMRAKARPMARSDPLHATSHPKSKPPMHYVSSSYSHGIHAIRTATPLCTDDSGRAQMTSRRAHHAQPLRTFRDMRHVYLQRNRARRSACGQSPLREPPRHELSMPSPEAPAAPASARESWEWEIIPKSIIYSIGERPALLPLPAASSSCCCCYCCCYCCCCSSRRRSQCSMAPMRRQPVHCHQGISSNVAGMTLA